MSGTFATADIGSNTVHMLIAQTDGRAVVRLDNDSQWLGLGEMVANTGVIDKAKTQELVTALSSFRKLAAARKASQLYVFATEAVRRAKNHNETLTFIRSKSGVNVQIVSPEREAELAIRGAMLDSYGEMPTTFFDVGGGSAQVVRIDGSARTDFHSLPLGTGTLRANAQLEDRPNPDSIKRLDRIIEKTLAPVEGHSPSKRLVGCGGVARGLVRALHPDGDRWIHRYELDYLQTSLANLSSTEVSRRFDISPTRASSLLPGVAVISKLMGTVGIDKILVSEFGIREGAILGLAEGSIEVGKG
ncbi:MAG: hypothetical protein ACR2HJ_09930 [Fimbriimonadales bacterium]